MARASAKEIKGSVFTSSYSSQAKLMATCLGYCDLSHSGVQPAIGASFENATTIRGSVDCAQDGVNLLQVRNGQAFGMCSGPHRAGVVVQHLGRHGTQ